MKKKFSDKEKIERAKTQLLRALSEVKNNPNKVEALGFVTGQMAHTVALLDSNTRDEMAIVFVAASLLDEVQPSKPKTKFLEDFSATQLELVETKDKGKK